MKITLNHILLGALLVACGIGYFVFTKHMEEKAKMEAVAGFIAKQPVLQMILKDHPANAAYFTQHFTYHYEKHDGLAGMEAAVPELQQGLDQNYAIDYIWYYDEAALRNYLVREYNFLIAMKKADPKGGACNAYVKDSTTWANASRTAGGDYFKLYMDSSTKLFKSAIPHKLYAIWPGIPGYKEELQKVMMKFIMSMVMAARTDPKLVESLKNPSLEGRDCTIALLMDGSLVQMTPPEISLLWRGMMEASRTAIEAGRKKRGWQ